jgi:hypothetical protein
MIGENQTAVEHKDSYEQHKLSVRPAAKWGRAGQADLRVYAFCALANSEALGKAGRGMVGQTIGRAHGGPADSSYYAHDTVEC